MSVTREDFNDINVEQLRKMVRERGWTGGTVLSATRDQLIDYLLTGHKPANNSSLNNIINVDALAELLSGKVNVANDDSQLREVIDALAKRVATLEANKPQVVKHQIQVNNLEPVNVGLVHRMTETVIEMLSVGLNVFLYGPAGTGKTSIAKVAAKALQVPCYCQSVCAQSSVIMLSGYQDAHGNYVPSAFRKAYEHGGVYCLDEIDAGNANVLTWLNSAIDNGECTFPDAVIKRHVNFYCIATGNTVGNGATKEFLGRNPIDGATLNRFRRVEIDIDPSLELAMANGNRDWYDYCILMRKKISDLKIRYSITSRDIRDGAKMIAAGVSLEIVVNAMLAGLSDQDRLRLV